MKLYTYEEACEAQRRLWAEQEARLLTTGQVLALGVPPGRLEAALRIHVVREAPH